MSLRLTNGDRGEGETVAAEGMGAVIAWRRHGLCLDTHTHTLSPSWDSNLRAIFRPDDWQLDAYSSLTRPADNSGYPPLRHHRPSISVLFLHFFFFFCNRYDFNNRLTCFPPSLLNLSVFSSLSRFALSLSLRGLLWDYYNDRGDKGHLSHVRRG